MIDIFVKNEIIDDISVEVAYDKLKEKNYSFSAGQYFEVKIEYMKITQEEFKNKMRVFSTNLDKYYEKSKLLEKEIEQRLEELKFD